VKKEETAWTVENSEAKHEKWAKKLIRFIPQVSQLKSKYR
jgi:hypothetical protein